MLTLKFILFGAVSTIFLSECSTKDYCSPHYCNNSKQHTLCKYQSKVPASRCTDYEKTISNENERRLILDKINTRRNKVAAGEIRSLPPAQSMLKLVWNRELEASAQRWADQCVEHSVPDIKDTCRDLAEMPVGQNIATVIGDAPGLTALALVDVWYMELLNINSSILSRYIPSPEAGYSHYDYFTQLVWEESDQVGCAGVKFKERLKDQNVVKYRTIYRLICNFARAGNRRNKAVYSNGLPCSKCPLDGVCDSVHSALCVYHFKENIEKEENNGASAPVRTKIFIEHTTEITFPDVIDPPTEETFDVLNISTINLKSDKETNTQIDFFSHLYDYTRQTITLSTKANSCEDVMAVDDFVELLKKKLSNDPMIKELLLTTKSASNIGNSESSFHDDNVAAFVNRIYNKKETTTPKKTTISDYVNSTFLVDLIEAVIFRNSDKISVSEEYSQNLQPMSTVRPVMIQAALGEIKQNEEFTGHYFFPEEDEESTSEITESYYDNTNLVAPDEVLDDLKMSTLTKDFLDDILETDSSTEKIDNNFINNNHVNTKKNKTNLKNNRSKQNYRNGYDSNEYNRQSKKVCKRNIIKKSISCVYDSLRKYKISYKELLLKITADLKYIKLKEIFNCMQNSSTRFVIQLLLLLMNIYQNVM